MSRHRKGIGGKIVPVLVALAIAGLVYSLPAFHVTDITVSGLRQLDPKAVIEQSGLVDGQHLFSQLGGSPGAWLRLRYGGVEQNLTASFPFIREVSVQMKFPSEIRIEIEERLEVAYLVIPDGYVMIDKAGVALTILSTAPANIPVIDGLTVSQMTLGQPLTVDVPAALNSAIELMGAIIEADKDQRIDLKLLPRISSMMPISSRKVYMTVELPGSGTLLSVSAETGDDALDDMLWLRYAVAQNAFADKGQGVLDLTGSHKTFTPN